MTTENIVVGLHAVRHALEHSLERVTEIWIQEDKKNSQAIRELLDIGNTLPVSHVKKQTLDRISGYQRHQGIAIRRKTVNSTARDLEELLESSDMHSLLFLVIDGVQDPHNLGACLRTADAAGVNAVILPRDRSVGINTTVSKVASGAAESIPVFRVSNLARSLRRLQTAGIWIIGTTETAQQSIYDTDLRRPVALVVGSEGQGLRENTRKHCDILVSIPMHGVVESLNVSVTTGICLYEVLRQRQIA